MTPAKGKVIILVLCFRVVVQDVDGRQPAGLDLLRGGRGDVVAGFAAQRLHHRVDLGAVDDGRDGPQDLVKRELRDGEVLGLDAAGKGHVGRLLVV